MALIETDCTFKKGKLLVHYFHQGTVTCHICVQATAYHVIFSHFHNPQDEIF